MALYLTKGRIFREDGGALALVNGSILNSETAGGGNGWVVTGSSAVGTIAIGSLTLTNAVSFFPVEGTLYEITFDISAYTSGTVAPIFGGEVYGIPVSGNGTGYKFLVEANAARAASKVHGINGDSFTGSVDNLSIKESYVDDLIEFGGAVSLGHQLDQIENAGWITDANVTLPVYLDQAQIGQLVTDAAVTLDLKLFDAEVVQQVTDALVTYAIGLNQAQTGAITVSIIEAAVTLALKLISIEGTTADRVAQVSLDHQLDSSYVPTADWDGTLTLAGTQNQSENAGWDTSAAATIPVILNESGVTSWDANPEVELITGLQATDHSAELNPDPGFDTPANYEIFLVGATTPVPQITGSQLVSEYSSATQIKLCRIVDPSFIKAGRTYRASIDIVDWQINGNATVLMSITVGNAKFEASSAEGFPVFFDKVDRLQRGVYLTATADGTTTNTLFTHGGSLTGDIWGTFDNFTIVEATLDAQWDANPLLSMNHQLDQAEAPQWLVTDEVVFSQGHNMTDNGPELVTDSGFDDAGQWTTVGAGTVVSGSQVTTGDPKTENKGVSVSAAVASTIKAGRTYRIQSDFYATNAFGSAWAAIISLGGVSLNFQGSDIPSYRQKVLDAFNNGFYLTATEDGTPANTQLIWTGTTVAGGHYVEGYATSFSITEAYLPVEWNANPLLSLDHQLGITPAAQQIVETTVAMAHSLGATPEAAASIETLLTLASQHSQAETPSGIFNAAVTLAHKLLTDQDYIPVLYAAVNLGVTLSQAQTVDWSVNADVPLGHQLDQALVNSIITEGTIALDTLWAQLGVAGWNTDSSVNLDHRVTEASSANWDAVVSVSMSHLLNMTQTVQQVAEATIALAHQVGADTSVLATLEGALSLGIQNVLATDAGGTFNASVALAHRLFVDQAYTPAIFAALALGIQHSQAEDPQWDAGAALALAYGLAETITNTADQVGDVTLNHALGASSVAQMLAEGSVTLSHTLDALPNATGVLGAVVALAHSMAQTEAVTGSYGAGVLFDSGFGQTQEGGAILDAALTLAVNLNMDQLYALFQIFNESVTLGILQAADPANTLITEGTVDLDIFMDDANGVQQNLTTSVTMSSVFSDVMAGNANFLESMSLATGLSQDQVVQAVLTHEANLSLGLAHGLYTSVYEGTSYRVRTSANVVGLLLSAKVKRRHSATLSAKNEREARLH